MKKLLFILFCSPVFLFAQDCDLKNIKDNLNQDTRLTTGFKSFTEGFKFSASASKTEIDLFFVIDKSTLCFDEYSRAVLLFDSTKSKGNYKNSGTTNCKGYFHFIFKNQDNPHSTLKNLMSRKIKSVQFTATDKTVKQFNLTDEEKELMNKMINCIVSEGKLLINDSWKPKKN